MDIQEIDTTLNNPNDQPVLPINIQGFFKTTRVVPTAPPNGLGDQIRIFNDGASYKLYIWDNGIDQVWRPIWLGDFTTTGTAGISQSSTTINISAS